MAVLVAACSADVDDFENDCLHFEDQGELDETDFI